jgi:cation transport ATPase
MSVWIIPYANPELMMKHDLVNGNTAYILVLCFLSTIIQFGIGYTFYVGAYRSIVNGIANMDVLVVLGTTSAWMYGIVLCFIGHSTTE